MMPLKSGKNSVLAFFDKYLKEKREIDLIEKAKAYPEIEIATNMQLGQRLKYP